MNWQDRKLLYVSLHDLSEAHGPGVNELEFYTSLAVEFGERLHAVIPRPKLFRRELSGPNIVHFQRLQRRTVRGIWDAQRALRGTLQEVLDAHAFELIVIRLNAFPLGLAQVLRQTRTPYVVKTLDLPGLPPVLGVHTLLRRMLSPLQKRLTRRILQGALAVDCCTPELTRRNCAHYRLDPRRVLLVENATNVQRFAPRDTHAARRQLGIEDWEPVLGYVGSRPSERGGWQMLDVAKRLRADFPHLGVVIVGEGGEDRLRRRAAQLGLAQRCLIPGGVEYDAIPDFVNAFDIGFALDHPRRFRLVGNSYQKVREYLACGKSVVTCLRPSSELVEMGLVEAVPPRDVAAIEAAVRQCQSRSPLARESQARRAVAFARERFSVGATLRQRLAFWNSWLSVSLHPTRPVSRAA